MVVLYATPTCPKCHVLRSKMDAKHIEYTKEMDIEVLTQKGISTVPYLEVDGQIMDFAQANQWINAQ